MTAPPLMAAPDKTPDRIAGMFDAIAPRYDLLNHLLSAGIDRRWRTRAIASLRLTGRETLMTSAPARPTSRSRRAAVGAARVVGVDFAGAMLALGLRKVRAAGQVERIALVRGDAMRLPARDRSATRSRSRSGSATCSGRRWRARRWRGCCAGRPAGDPRVRRAASPGRERALPLVLQHVLPLIGRMISGHTRRVFLSAGVGRHVSAAG